MQELCPFFHYDVCLFLLIQSSSSKVVNISLSAVMYLSNIFSLFVAYLLTFLMVTSDKQTFFIFMQWNLSSFNLMVCEDFLSYLKNLLQLKVLNFFLYCLTQVVQFCFTCLCQPQLIVCVGVGWGERCSGKNLLMWIINCFSTIYWIISAFLFAL